MANRHSVVRFFMDQTLKSKDELERGENPELFPMNRPILRAWAESVQRSTPFNAAVCGSHADPPMNKAAPCISRRQASQIGPGAAKKRG